MFIVHSDSVFKVELNTSPDYSRRNPLLKLMGLLETAQLAAQRDFYLADRFEYLFPFKSLSSYGPQGADADNLNPEQQDNKTDFQKQNVKDFETTDTILMRGLVNVGNWTGPFLRISYRGGPDSQLSVAANHQLGESIKLFLKVAETPSSSLITVPYNPLSDRYEIELWGYPGADLRSKLDGKSLAAFDRGELQVRTDLVHGSIADFSREKLDGLDMATVSPSNTMHPILPLHIELAWANADVQIWDSQNDANYHYEFNMILRGWEHFLGTGMSSNPHGGVGFLEYRNLMSNYFQYGKRNELGRNLNTWNFNAFGNKNHGNGFEPFFAVDYMDIHLLKGNCGIGLHRHRDNQEVFLMMEGKGFMVIGDWCKMPERERCFEIRTLRSGHFAMLKGGNLHALMNATDEDISLFMFGGYD
jgi:mannose-6-phosphate isomerase-like protein (cupin superfamily)